jgi:hypothetical protein
MSIDTRAQRAADGVHESARGVDPMTQIVDLKREVKTRQRTGIAVTAAVAVVLVAGALAFSSRWLGSDEAAVTPTGQSTTTRAQLVAADFFAAVDAYDAEEMLAFLTDDAVRPVWNSASAIRDDAAWREAAGWTQLREPCRADDSGGSTVVLRCDYAVHALGSDELGRGPFGGGYWTLHVKADKVVYAYIDFPFDTNGFAAEMWEPLVAFVESEYPRDVDVMYTDDRADGKEDPAALRLWEQHIDDYVASETVG